jgi:hypothetical protein
MTDARNRLGNVKTVQGLPGTLPGNAAHRRDFEA